MIGTSFIIVVYMHSNWQYTSIPLIGITTMILPILTMYMLYVVWYNTAF